jgi:hypothetical protein
MYHDVQRLVYSKLPIFSSCVPQYNYSFRPKKLLPTRIGFLYEPKESVLTHSGIRFIIPNSVSHKDMLFLDKMILESGFTEFDAPKPIYNKFVKAGLPKRRQAFNYLIPSDGKLQCSNIQCFVSHTCEQDYTVNSRPGTVTDLSSISMLLHVLLLLAHYKDVSEDQLLDNIQKLESLYFSIDFAFDYEDTLRLFLDTYEIEGIENQTCIQNFICAFHDIFLNPNDYMGWT